MGLTECLEWQLMAPDSAEEQRAWREPAGGGSPKREDAVAKSDSLDMGVVGQKNWVTPK